MIGSIFQVMVLLNFYKIGRRVGEAAIEVDEILKRKKGQKISAVSNT
jgi:hypothetical protein